MTLAIFSGVPDPEWTVTSNDPDYMEIEMRFNAAIQNGWAYLPEDLTPLLGYKGILVTPNTNKKKSVLQGETEERLIVGPTTVQLQLLLFKTMPKSALAENLRQQISNVIASGTVKVQVEPKKN